jgi:hypothetical protein
MEATLIPRNNVVHCQSSFATAAILTSIAITPEDFAAGKFDVRAWTAHLMLEPDDGRTRENQSHGAQVTPAIGYHGRFSPKDQYNCPPRCADVDGLEVRVEDQDGFVHGTAAISAIIA